MTLANLFPASFLTLAVAHFLALLSPGQDFFLIIGHAIRFRLPGSRYICLGVALGNGLYIALTIVGWNSIKDHQGIFTAIEWLGAGYLIWIGFQLIKSKPYNKNAEYIISSLPSWQKQLGLGLSSALLNPKNALFYMSLMTAILGNEVSLIQQACCGIWMFFAVWVWDLLIATGISQTKFQNALHRYVHIIERVSGVILLALGLALIII